MTKELAIKILSTRDRYGCLCGWTSGYTEALDMAIEALKAPTDLISRDKVLNLVLDVCNDVMNECETVTGICGEEVYTDIREVDAILKCNKRIRNGIRNL